MSPDNICEKYANKGISIKIRVEDDMVFIEGDSDALEFIGELFLTQARFKKDCGFDISPSGAGKIFFKPKSTHGIYIHRIPCEHKRGKRMSQSTK